MKAEELRIGNYVYDVDGDILKIDEITNNYVKFKNTSLRNRLCKIQPIPLSEEILLKCGFEKNDGWYILNIINDWTFIFYQPIHGVVELSISKHGAVLSEQCKFLHQLQNLYFALKGQELEIKL